MYNFYHSKMFKEKQYSQQHLENQLEHEKLFIVNH